MSTQLPEHHFGFVIVEEIRVLLIFAIPWPMIGGWGFLTFAIPWPMIGGWGFLTFAVPWPMIGGWGFLVSLQLRSLFKFFIANFAARKRRENYDCSKRNPLGVWKGKNIKTWRNWCNCIEIVQPEECLQLFRVPVECAMIDQPQQKWPQEPP